MQDGRKKEKIYKHADKIYSMRYIPILRLGTTEHGILMDDLSRNLQMLPHLEVANLDLFRRNIQAINSRFGDVLVELPEYLAERTNKHQESVQNILNQYEQVDFYTNFQSQIGIPVVSCMKSRRDYSVLLDRFRSLRDQFDRVAVRCFVYQPVLTITQLRNLTSLFEDLRNEDIILFDILKFLRIERRQIQKLRRILETMSYLAPESDAYILNALCSDLHNYGPLLANILDLNGFGDFSTTRRFEASGGRGALPKIIRYYYSSSHELIRFEHDTSYLVAVQDLTNSSYWDNNVSGGHLGYCNVCNEIHSNQHNNAPVYWKRYRIVHYIKSVVNETLPSIPGTDPRSLDIDGYDRISRRRGL